VSVLPVYLLTDHSVTLRGPHFARIHAVFGNYGNACVDRPVIGCLRSGVLPAADLTCLQGIDY
jgi:hypothetical protein